ncbi:hypothetical protein B1F79_02895 [Coxiella-like endosymbiont of Rhipicephalus sanguineus]|uniref:hypothetical protein n=1 Tax=Coxiella-like endosymbiont of Rhipicephalus sanguineus TaxID=1955402 RepID=UPI002041C31E|nr:hypothetical protein [Coxiella-like endosymbiont of Rhipicephalus sanguineus]MBT8506530.1 hypothetical protein [Coxiella-like endosymbiont of Rhipicephalus sanguineus]
MVFVEISIAVVYLSENEQGWVMGVTGGIMALCFGLTSFLTAYLVSYGVNISIIWRLVAGMVVSGLLMVLILKFL